MTGGVRARGDRERIALFGLGFRPFFLGLAVHAVVAIPIWTLVWIGVLPAPSWLVPTWWHGHEMVYGFVAAAIAGFLLTASPVWTGGRPLTGGALATLAALWAFGRVAFFAASAVPAWLVAVVDLAFLPAVAIAVMRTLRGSGQNRNHALVVVIAALAIANGLVHAEALGLVGGVAGRALRFAVDLVIVLILVIGGRITPAFTRNALRREGLEAEIRPRPWLGGAAIGAAAALALATPIAGRGSLTGVLAVAAGLATAARLAGWQARQVWSDPLLWSLHAGAIWVAAGLLLVGASDLGAPVPATAGLHALTAGAMGTTILAVITRVGLGHTGRPLVLPPGVVWAHALVHVGAGLRVAAAFAAAGQRPLLVASGLAWAAGFGLFLLRYGPILATPRPDGRPG